MARLEEGVKLSVQLHSPIASRECVRFAVCGGDKRVGFDADTNVIG